MRPNSDPSKEFFNIPQSVFLEYVISTGVVLAPLIVLFYNYEYSIR